MLLTLSTRSLIRRISGNGGGSLSLLDLPDFVSRELQLRGLNVPASMLSGWSLQDLDDLRDRADKAGCPCLVLIEDTPLRFAADDVSQEEKVRERVKRLAVAANRLGCNALALRCDAPDSDDAFEQTAAEIKALMPLVERFELNLLLAPSEGLTSMPDRLTDLIKRIGGFRIGSLPSFAAAAETGDAIDALRKLAPYAGAIHASVGGFSKSGRHEGYDLEACVAAIRSVGFANTLAIEYTGDDDPVENIEHARDVLQAAIDAES
jgi:sugar phosphate isomerase/epimerase